MAITYTREADRPRLNTLIEGDLTLDEVLRHLRELHETGALPCADLVDARGLAGPPLSTDGLRSLVEQVRRLRTPGLVLGPRAVVVGRDVSYGLARMFAHLVAAHMTMAVFRDPGEAEVWLESASGTRD